MRTISHFILKQIVPGSILCGGSFDYKTPSLNTLERAKFSSPSPGVFNSQKILTKIFLFVFCATTIFTNATSVMCVSFT